MFSRKIVLGGGKQVSGAESPALWCGLMSGLKARTYLRGNGNNKGKRAKGDAKARTEILSEARNDEGKWVWNDEGTIPRRVPRPGGPDVKPGAGSAAGRWVDLGNHLRLPEA